MGKKVDISNVDFKYYKPLEESLKQSAGKGNYFVTKGVKEKEQWKKNKTEQYIKNVKKDLDKGVFEEAIKQKKLTLNQVFKIIESVGGFN